MTGVGKRKAWSVGVLRIVRLLRRLPTGDLLAMTGWWFPSDEPPAPELFMPPVDFGEREDEQKAGR